MVRLLTIVFLIAFWAQPAWAGPGHDHGAGHDAAPSSTTVVPHLESVGTELELVAVVVDHELMLYLDESATNEPVDDAVIEVSGDSIETLTATQSGSGTYTLSSEWLEGTGTKALTFVVTAGDRIELLNGTLDLGHAEASAFGSTESAELLSEPLLWIVAGLAAFLGFLLASAFRPAAPAKKAKDEPVKRPTPRLDVVGGGKRTATLVLAAAMLTSAVINEATAGPGHDHGAGGHDEPATGGYVPRKLPGGEVFLPKPSQRLLSVRTAVAEAKKTQKSEELIGTVIADPASEGRVQAPVDGSIELAKDGVAFVGERVKAGDVLAYLAPSMPVYERGYLEQLTAEVDGKMRIAEQRLKRLQGVRDNYIAQKDIDDTLVELSALQEQKRVLEPKGQRIALTAPVDGIISVANVRAGQVVDARDTLFEIVDPDRLWIEAIDASGRDYDDLDAAHAVLDGGSSVPIRFVGSAPVLRHQARPLFFEVARSDPSLAIGTRVHVVLQTGSPVNGIVLPETAVVRATNGLNRIWVKVGAEQFEPQDVRTEPLGNGEVLVTGGLETGSRVVVSGSELINQVR